MHVLSVIYNKLSFSITNSIIFKLYVSESCFRTLAVILVQGCFLKFSLPFVLFDVNLHVSCLFVVVLSFCLFCFSAYINTCLLYTSDAADER